MLACPWLDAAVAALAGLLIGSFLNVVIARSPHIMYRGWLNEALDSLRAANAPVQQTSLWSLVFGPDHRPPENLTRSTQDAWLALQELPPLSLSRPSSRCRSCGHGIRWYDNIPLLSYMLLRGRCRACHQSYGLRYPAIELLTGVLFAYCGWRWGLSLSGALWASFCATLLVLACIDWEQTLLPDHLVLPLLWLGLLGAACGGLSTSLHDAVWGAATGYLSLWSISKLYLLLRGTPGMGHGDFKLLAALGAWLGWQALLPILLLSSITGLMAGLIFKLLHRLRPGGYFPFGPFLGLAGLLILLIGPQTFTHAILP